MPRSRTAPVARKAQDAPTTAEVEEAPAAAPAAELTVEEFWMGEWVVFVKRLSRLAFIRRKWGLLGGWLQRIKNGDRIKDGD